MTDTAAERAREIVDAAAIYSRDYFDPPGPPDCFINRNKIIAGIAAALRAAEAGAIEMAAQLLDKMQEGESYTNIYAYMAREVRALASPLRGGGTHREGRGAAPLPPRQRDWSAP